MIEVIFLGTSASIPTRERGLPCIVLRRKGELLMFDCGEGAQRNFLQAKLGVNRPMRIFISHLHGDHVLGLPGLLSSMSLLGRRRAVFIYGPKGLRSLLNTTLSLIRSNINYEIHVMEVTSGIVCETEEYVVKAEWGVHSVPNLMYRIEERERPGKFHPERALELGVPRGPLWGQLQRGKEVTLEDGRIIRPEDVMDAPRPGLKVVYTGDTGPCEEIASLSEGADLLIHEATYSDNMRERALVEGHSTAKLAAVTAHEAHVRRLVLTHISARYSQNDWILEKEAREVFPATIMARDFLKLRIEYPA